MSYTPPPVPPPKLDPKSPPKSSAPALAVPLPPPLPPQKPLKVLEVKRDPWIMIPFAFFVAATIVATAYHKITPEVAGLILAALGFPSMLGLRTMPQLVNALVAELQRQIAASTPPPSITSLAPGPITSVVPGAAKVPTGTEHPLDIERTIPPKAEP